MIITREEYKQYMKVKNSIQTRNAETQTDSSNGTPNQHVLQGLLVQSDEDYDPNKNDDSDETTSNTSDLDDDDGTDDEDQNIRSRKRRKQSQKKVKYYGDEKQYYNALNVKRRKTIDEIENRIINMNYVEVPMRFRVLESDMDMRLKAMAVGKIEQLNSLDPSSGEYMKLYTWIENVCKLPIGKYKKLRIDASNSIDEITSFLDITKNNLDKKVFGHLDAKNQIIRLLAKWIANPDSKGLVIGIEGPMGAGKTTLCNGVCESLGLPFGFVQLGGISDGSYLVGHSYTYEGSRWGRIAEILMRVGCMNPVLYFDELDKISTTRHGAEIANILIHLTDGSQNDKFHDKYFSDIEIDLSKCLIVFSYNNAEFINPILKDRMVTIKTDGYGHKDKLKIAKEYMLPIILKEFSFTKNDLVIPDDIMSYMISLTNEEQGVRNFKRTLEEVVSQINLHRLLKKNVIDGTELRFPLTLTKDIVDKFVKKTQPKNMSHPMMYI